MIPLLRAFVRTRWLAHRLKTRGDVARWQAAQLERWRARILRQFPAARDGSEPPVMDKAVLMADFAAFNRIGLTADEGWAMFEGRAPQRPGFSVGASTGTSGNRGLYVVSDAERQMWVGTMLAKTLPRFPLETARIALVLPLNSALYRSAAHTARLQLRFFDLNDGLDGLLPRVAACAPDTLIAPPKVLRALAEADLPLKVKHVFSGAEVLDPLDRAVIEARFGVIVREIYMATEGLLGVACAHGTLHLCEDVMHFEWAPADGLVNPIISDFTRTTQAMCRYSLNDLLRLSEAPCPCGSPLQAVAAIEGRCDDILVLDGKRVTPDVLRNVLVDADRRIGDFRLRQTAADRLELTLSDDLPTDAARAAQAALAACLARLGIVASVGLEQARLTTSARKLRRVERVWHG